MRRVYKFISHGVILLKGRAEKVGKKIAIPFNFTQKNN